MGADLTLRAAGLFTDPNPHSDAPQGALRIADNVVIRRAGVLEPRHGFRAEALAGGARYVGIHPGPTGDSSEYYVQATSGLNDDTASSVPISVELAEAIVQTGEYAGASAGRLYGRLYIPAVTSGVSAAVEDSTARVAGLPRAGQPYVASASTAIPAWLANNEAVAYRAILVTDLGDRVLAGPTSGRTVYRNTTGSTVYPSVRVDLAPGMQTTWSVQLYRSLTAAAGVTPGDEMYLVAEQQISSADALNGYISIADRAEDTALGTSLYTNATQQGALQENGRPPAHEVVEAFNEMMFYGRTTEPHRLVLKFRELPNQAVPDPTSIGITSGVATFTLVSGETPTSENVGQFIVVDDDTVISNGTGLEDYVYLADESPLTMSQNANATNAGLVVTFVDWLAIDDSAGAWTTYDLVVPYPGAGRTPSLADGTLQYGDPATILALLAASLEAQNDGLRVIASSDALILERPFAIDGAIYARLPPRFASLIEAVPASYAAQAATGSTPGARNLPPSVQYTSTQREYVNRVYYSKKQEPEHVPPVNFVDLGSDSEPILAMQATRRALFIFKTDGVWTIQGDTPETLRVTQIDSTARLLHPKAATVGGDRVFAWTDAGVVMIGEGGVEANLSAPAIEPDLRAIQVALQATSDPASGSTLGCFLHYQDGEERLLLGVPAAVGDDMVASVYQYDMRTQAWTRWTFADYEVSDAATIAGRGLFSGQNASAEGEVWREVLASDEAPHSDETVADGMVSASTSGGISTVLLAGSRNNFPVGTWVVQPGAFSSARGVVIATRDGGDGPDEIDVYMMEGSISTVGDYNAITGYRPVEQCIEWVAKTAQAPTVTKHWQRGVLTYESDRRMYETTLSFRSDMVHTATPLTPEHALHDDALPEDVPFMVTRDHARSAILLPKLCISQGGAQWALSALHLDYELGSSRSGRRAR